MQAPAHGYDRPVPARRITLVLAIMIGLAVLAASVAPPPEERAREDGASPREQGERRSPRRREPLRVLRFDIRPGRQGGAAVREVRRGAHVVITAFVDRPGQVTVEGLGLVAEATRLTPAVFDLFARRPGRHEIVFRPVRGGARRLGVLLVSR